MTIKRRSSTIPPSTISTTCGNYSLRLFGKFSAHNPWLPITLPWRRWVSFLCYQLFGPWACGFHLISLLLNALAVALVFAIASRVMGDRRAAFAATALFALLPVHVEVVKAVSAAMDLDLAFFYFLTFWCFLCIEDRAGGRRLYALVATAVSYALTLLSKEPALMLPV